MLRKTSLPGSSSSMMFPVLAGLLAVAIFAVDTLVPLGMAIAVLYVIVVLLSVGALTERGILIVALACVAFALLSYIMQHAPAINGTPMVRLVVSLLAIAITTALALKNIRSTGELHEQAQLLDLTHDTVFVRDMSDVITYWNRGAEALYGWRREEAIGRVAHELLKSEFPASFERIMAELLNRGRWEGELVHAARDGRRIAVSSRWSVQRSGAGRPVAILETNNDITERKEAQQSLLQAERELRLTIDTIPILAWKARSDGSIEYLNKRWLDYTGLAADDALGWKWQNAIHPDDRDGLVNEWRAILAAGRAAETEARLRRYDGAYRWFLLRCEPYLDESGTLIGWYGTNADIEDRKLAEESLRRAEQELRATIDTIPAMVMRAQPDGTVDFVNARWVEQGFADDALLKDWSSLVHPDDIEVMNRRRNLSLETGEFYETEARFRRADGDYRWFLIRAVSQRDATGKIVKRYATATEIEDRKRFEDALRRNEALLEETQEISRTGSLGLDVATGELFWSAEGARIFGFEPGTKPDIESVLKRVHPEDLWLAQRSIERANAGEPDSAFEFRLVMPDGALKYIYAVSHATRDVSERRVLRALVDVTAARSAEAALHQTRMELAHITRVTTLGELTTSIAHEVNQPLAAIITNGEVCLRLLDRSPLDLAELGRAVADIISSGKRTSEIIRRLRALSSKVETPKATIDINEMIEEVIPLVRGEVLNHRATLRLELTGDLPEVVGDRVQLQQVMINLVVNGMEAMATVSGRARNLIIRSELDGGDVVVAVQDSGVGFEAGIEMKLFDAFFTTKPTGMGMGLSICRSIVEDHGGRLWATRNSGPGATFHFSLQAHGGRPH